MTSISVYMQLRYIAGDNIQINYPVNMCTYIHTCTVYVTVHGCNAHYTLYMYICRKPSVFLRVHVCNQYQNYIESYDVTTLCIPMNHPFVMPTLYMYTCTYMYTYTCVKHYIMYICIFHLFSVFMLLGVDRREGKLFMDPPRRSSYCVLNTGDYITE